MGAGLRNIQEAVENGDPFLKPAGQSSERGTPILRRHTQRRLQQQSCHVTTVTRRLDPVPLVVIALV
jgi:hypothetical protein